MQVRLFLLKKEVTRTTKYVGVYRTEVTPIGVYVSESLANEAKEQHYKEIKELKESSPPISFEVAMDKDTSKEQRKLWIDWDIKRYHASIPVKFVVESIPLFK